MCFCPTYVSLCTLVAWNAEPISKKFLPMENLLSRSDIEYVTSCYLINEADSKYK
jgi:hypothetical protein